MVSPRCRPCLKRCWFRSAVPIDEPERSRSLPAVDPPVPSVLLVPERVPVPAALPPVPRLVLLLPLPALLPPVPSVLAEPVPAVLPPVPKVVLLVPPPAALPPAPTVELDCE